MDNTFIEMATAKMLVDVLAMGKMEDFLAFDKAIDYVCESFNLPDDDETYQIVSQMWFDEEKMADKTPDEKLATIKAFCDENKALVEWLFPQE